MVSQFLQELKILITPNLNQPPLNPLPTCLIPKFVKRIIGGNANIIVATTPGVNPTPKALPQELNKQSLELFALYPELVAVSFQKCCFSMQ